MYIDTLLFHPWKMTQSKHRRERERERDPPSAVCKKRMKWQNCQAMQRRLPNVFHTLRGASAESRAGRTMGKGGRKHGGNICVEPLCLFRLISFWQSCWHKGVLVQVKAYDGMNGWWVVNADNFFWPSEQNVMGFWKSMKIKPLNVQINQTSRQCNETNASFDPGIIWCINYLDRVRRLPRALAEAG